MDIKNMHEMIEKLVGCTKAELDKKGIEEIDAKELGEVTDIIKDLCEAQYYRTLVVAMESADFGWDYDEEGPLEEGRRGYRGQPRSKSSGRYMSRGDGRRRGYEDKMPMYDEWMRDMDRYDHGRMYYTDVGSGMSGENSTGNSGSTRGYMDNHGGQYSSRMQRDEREGRSGEARRGYMETKEMHKGNTAEDKQKKMKELERYMNELSSDLTEMIADASPEEKNMLKTKLTTLSTKIS